MGSRLDLHNLLIAIDGVEKAYFQPPEDLKLVYPCIVYKRLVEDVKFADDIPYLRKKRYQVTVIDPDPDSTIPDIVGGFPLCAQTTAYASDNLNHSVYNLYY